MTWSVSDLSLKGLISITYLLAASNGVFVCGAQAVGADLDGELPNVLFIAIDDLTDVTAQLKGSLSIRTPHIEALASRGILFSNAHCTAPSCNPSRTSVMTGVSPSTSGVYQNGQDWRRNEALKSIPTIPSFFRSHGYKVAGGGKIYHAYSFSAGALTGYFEPEAWDEYFPSKSQQMPAEVYPDGWPVNGTKEIYGGYFDWAPLNVGVEEMADAKVVRWAEKQLSQKHGKPLFLAVGIYRPHVPWWVPSEYFGRHPVNKLKLSKINENDLDDIPEAGLEMLFRSWHRWIVGNGQWEKAVQGYLASASFADDMVGRLLNALDEGPLRENTVVILWSDHGYHLGVKEHWEKFTLWDQATRVPLIVVDRRFSAEGSVTNQPVSLLDIYPTLVELCGLESPDHLEGTSLVPLIRDPLTKTNRAVVTTYGFQNHAVRSERWRYIRYAEGAEELYDHNDDPYEWKNIAGDPHYREVIEEHKDWLPRNNAQPTPR
jgi:arylsulfatase A-like enzyme